MVSHLPVLLLVVLQCPVHRVLRVHPARVPALLQRCLLLSPVLNHFLVKAAKAAKVVKVANHQAVVNPQVVLKIRHRKKAVKMLLNNLLNKNKPDNKA